MSGESGPTKSAHWDKSGRLKAYGKKKWEVPTLTYKVNLKDENEKAQRIEEFDGLNFLGYDKSLLFRYSMFRVPDARLGPNEYRLLMVPFAPADEDTWIIARRNLPRQGRPLYNKPYIRDAKTVFLVPDLRYVRLLEGAIRIATGRNKDFVVTALPSFHLKEYESVDLGPLKGKNVMFLDTYQEREHEQHELDTGAYIYVADRNLKSYDGLLLRSLLNMRCKVQACRVLHAINEVLGKRGSMSLGFIPYAWDGTNNDVAKALVKSVSKRAGKVELAIYDDKGTVTSYTPGMPSKDPESPFDGSTPAPVEEEASLRDNQFFRLLGPSSDGRYAILDKRTQMLRSASYSNLNEQAFLNDLAPKHFWQYYCEAPSEMDAMKAANRSVLQEMLSSELKTMGLFNDRNIKGLGWHMISIPIGGKRTKVPVCHAGDKLIVENKTAPLDEQIGENNVWVRQEAVDWGDPTGAADTQVAERAFKLVRHFKWTAPYHARLMSGWMALAPICGLLSFRPALWLQGDSGAGKSYFIGKVLKPLLGRTLDTLVATSTSAAIRRILHHGSTSFVIDEQEAETPKERELMDDILKIMRIASTEDSGDVIKSSMNSNSDIIRTRMRAMMLFSSVGHRIMLSTNTNRIMTVELRLCPEEERKEYYGRMQEMLEHLGDDETVGSRYLHFILKHVDNLMEAVKVGKTVAARNVHHIQRDADLLGSLVGASFVLEKGGGLPSEDDVQKAMDLLTSEFAARERSKDWENLLEEIRNLRIDVSNWANKGGGVEIKTVKVSQLVAAASGESVELMRELHREDAADMLLHYGIRVFSRRGDPKRMPGIGRVWIARSHKELERGLSQTPFGKIDYGRILARMPNTESPTKPVYMGGFSKRVVDMPLAKLWEGYADRPTEDDTPSDDGGLGGYSKDYVEDYSFHT